MTAADTTGRDLAIIKQLLALQIRLSVALQGDREASAQVKHDILAVCRGDLEQVGMRQGVKRSHFDDDGAQGLGCNGVAESPVGDSGHNPSPSLGTADALSVGDGPVTGGDPAGPGHPNGGCVMTAADARAAGDAGQVTGVQAANALSTIFAAATGAAGDARRQAGTALAAALAVREQDEVRVGEIVREELAGGITNSHAAGIRAGIDQLLDDMAEQPNRLDDLPQHFAVGVDHPHKLWVLKIDRIALKVANVLKLGLCQIDELVNLGAKRLSGGGAHKTSPSLGTGPTESAGEDGPGPAEHAGPGQTPGGAS
jgi:hypothetical protein